MKNTVKILMCLIMVLCSVLLVSCKHTPQDDFCPDGSHVFEEWTVLQEASCGAAGKKTANCKICGMSTSEDIPATGMHTVVLEWGKNENNDPSFTPQILKKCSCCNEVLEVQMLSALSENANVLLSNKSVNINLSSYDVVYPSVNTLAFNASVAKCLARDIGGISGDILNAKSDSGVALDYASKEILVGDTNRAESKATKALLTEEGFAIAVIDNKIAIVGSDIIQTIRAVNYFNENYVNDSAQVSLPKNIVVRSDETDVTLSSNYSVVFSKDLDDTVGSTMDPNEREGSRDYPCVAADVIIDYLGISSANRKTDAQNATDKEILIGKVDRQVYTDFVATLEGNEYGLLIKDGKIVIAAHNFLGLEMCVAQFKDLLVFAQSGSNWILPDDFYAKGIINEDWVINFPRPTGSNISLYNTMDSNDNSLQFLYTGSGVNGTAFDVYCSQLTSAGYEVITQNTIGNNKFKTFVNNTKGITLHVAYNDFTYEEDYVVNDEFYVDYQKSIRVISAPVSSVTLPDQDDPFFTANPTYTKVGNSTLTAVGLDVYAVGMSYVIKLEDGRFIIYDGGKNCPTPTDGQDKEGYTNTDEVVQLWDTLVALHGSTPSSSSPIHVAAWVITHSHGDHFEVFRDFLGTYGKNSSFKMDALIGNYPATNVLRTASGDLTDTSTMGYYNNIYNLQQKVTRGFKYIKVHTGQKLYFANVTMEVLMTYEDHNPMSIQAENDTTTVTRLTIATTSATAGQTTTAESAASTVTVLFLGDAQRHQSRYMCAAYGNYLSSDIVQVAHHGNTGCEIALYDLTAPKALLIPYSEKMVYKALHGQLNGSYADEVGPHLRNNIASVKYIYASAETIATTIPFDENGALYESFYNALTGQDLSFKNDNSINTWNGYLNKNN